MSNDQKPAYRSVEEILHHADDLAHHFETYDPNPADEVDVTPVTQ